MTKRGRKKTKVIKRDTEQDMPKTEEQVENPDEIFYSDISGVTQPKRQSKSSLSEDDL